MGWCLTGFKGLETGYNTFILSTSNMWKGPNLDLEVINILRSEQVICVTGGSAAGC